MAGKLSDPPVGKSERSENPPLGRDAGETRARKQTTPPLQNLGQHRKGWIVVMLLVLIAGGVVVRYWFWTQKANENELLLQGNIDVRQVNLSFKVEGRIAQVAVDEGDFVKQGQVIASLEKKYFFDELRLVTARRDVAAANFARLENGSRPEEIAQARAKYSEQQAAVNRSLEDLNRSRRMMLTRAVSPEEFDRIQAIYREEQARLNSAQAGLRLVEIGPRSEDISAGRAQLAAEQAAVVQSETRLKDSELVAPSTGYILTRAREKGAIVAPGETVFTLTLASPVWVRTYVNEMDLGRIRPNMRASIYTDTNRNKLYPGRIGFISPRAEFTPKSVETRELRTDLVYRLRIVVDDPKNELRQGMPVTVSMNLASNE